MSNATSYRTCPRSGLQFEKQAEWLMRANAFVAGHGPDALLAADVGRMGLSDEAREALTAPHRR